MKDLSRIEIVERTELQFNIENKITTLAVIRRNLLIENAVLCRSRNCTFFEESSFTLTKSPTYFLKYSLLVYGSS